MPYISLLLSKEMNLPLARDPVAPRIQPPFGFPGAQFGTLAPTTVPMPEPDSGLVPIGIQSADENDRKQEPGPRP